MIPTLLALALFQNPEIEGLWAGGFQRTDEFISMELHVTRSDAGLEATLSLPEEGFRFPVVLERDKDRIELAVSDGNGNELGRFRGELDAATLRGRVDGAMMEAGADCNLLRVVPLDEPTRERYAGTYRLDGDRTLRIVRVERPQGDALGIDVQAAGLRAILFAVSETELVAGQGESPLPIATRLRLHLDGAGAVERIELEHGGGSWEAIPVVEDVAAPEREVPQLLPDLDVERREVTIDAGDVRLAATLYLPPGIERPCPAVVQLHGSAPTRRQSQWYFYTSVCLRSGLAVLAYDKRGCGESTGRFVPFSVEGSTDLFLKLGRDAAAAHAWLRKQDGIDPDRVGLVGGSQAGWIMPLVAELTNDVRFILSGCGPPISAGEEQEHARLLQSGVGLAEADRRLEEYAGPRGYDPRPLLRQLKTPILWMFGERDDVIPTHACLQELEALAREGYTTHDVHVFPDTDHNFRTSRGDGILMEPVITSWLRKRGVLD